MGVLFPAALWASISWFADVVHLGLTVGFGAGQLSAPLKSNDGNSTAYDWSIGLAGSSRFLIHDVSDKIALPIAQHANSLGSEDGFGEECTGKVRRLISHYYLCSF